MRIHELLEACLEYVVVEGVLGADPLAVRVQLQTLDSNVDEAYFAHLWPLLARHSSTEVVIAADALPGVTVHDEKIMFHDELQRDLFRVLGEDDEGDPPVKTGDLNALLERYPARVRLRCTEDEIYYRLTGSRKRIPKITATIFTYLQLAARSREKGISALELGPLTDTTQNSAFHYIKVLVQLGLCAKIPASMHGSSTSVLVYRRFLEQNPHYRAHRARDSGEALTAPSTPHYSVDGDEDSSQRGAQDLGFNFSPFSELELVAGRIPKERLLRVLDSPGLKNHLLGNHHLLQVIGWPDDSWQVRHRRQLQRHITTLIDDGIVEYVDIGTSARACLRLTKYHPDFKPLVQARQEVIEAEKTIAFTGAWLTDLLTSVNDFEQPFQFEGTAVATQSIESQILTVIEKSGLKGCTLADTHKRLSSMFKRTLEHVVNRHDLAYLPPHLQHYGIRCVIESHQRVRRLRVFTSAAYQSYMEQLGQPLDAASPSPERGHFAELTFRHFASSSEDYLADSEALAAAIVPVGKVSIGRPRKSAIGLLRRNKVMKGEREEIAPPEVKFKYDNDIQERGRPRKYVFIVNDDGSRNRNVVGNILASPELPAVLIYIKTADVLIEAPPGYTGVGIPPDISDELIAAGKPPSFYQGLAAAKRKSKAKGRGKGKRKAQVKETDEVEEAPGREESDGEDLEVEEAEGGEPEGQPSRKRPHTDPSPHVEPESAIVAESSVTQVTPEDAHFATPSRAKRPRRAATRTRGRPASPSEAGTPEPSAKRPRRFQEVATAVDPELEALAAAVEMPLPKEMVAPEVIETMDQDMTPLVEATAYMENGISEPVANDEEPLVSIEDVKPERSTPRVVRVDIAVLRRANEIYQCLLDNGRVLSDQKLYVEQKTWSHKYAGTDHPNAPQVGAAMDRKVFKRMLNKLKDDGRIKERIATIPTTTGRWVKVPVLYITGTAESEIQHYIRGLANSTAPPGTPTTVARSKSALEYSAYKRSSLRPKSGTPQESPGPSPRHDSLSQREMFLAEPTMAAYLYGFQSGRCLRTKILHTALVKAFGSVTESQSVVSREPRVFALPFVFEELSVRDYFSFVQVRTYDEELYQWAQNNLDMRLRDVPPDMAEKAALTGRGSSSAKSMIRTLLSMLSFLQLIMPLAPADEADAVVHLPETANGMAHFARGNDVNSSTYFLLHDVVPVYNINDTSLPCIGFMSARTPSDVTVLWKIIKQASLESQPPIVRRMDVPPFPFAPDITGVLDMTIDHPKTLRGRNRWRHEIRLVPAQRANLEAGIDMTTRERKDVDVDKLAYDNALRPSYVNHYLDKRIRQLQDGLQPGGLHGERAAAARLREKEKRQRQKDAIRDELAARIRAARKVYDDRVREAAERAGVQVNQELLDYILHNRPMSRLGEIANDAELSAIIESFVRVKSGFAPSRRTVTRAALTTARSFPKRGAKSMSARNPNSKLRRYRHNWTKEDEELFLDAEAVIRARCRGTNNRGRLAMTQIFPNIGDQVLRTKLKKMLEQPGREAYYQRLEEAFYHLWVEHRGTIALPDANPTSHVDFDLRRHIDFLRERVNKNLLRLPVPSSTPAANQRAPDLPSAPIEVAQTYQWEYLKPINTSMDQLIGGAAAEDTRLYNIALASIVVEDKPVKQISVNRKLAITRALLKMIVGTPSEIYSVVEAGRLLPKEAEPQIAALVNDQVLMRIIPGSQTPGRQIVFTSQWTSQSDHLLPAEMDEEIDAALERFNNPEQSTEWPLIGNSGDLATLMTMVSNHEAVFDINLSHLPSLRTNRLQYNTRALNDDAFEFDFAVTRAYHAGKPEVPLPNAREFPRMTRWPGVGLVASDSQVERVIDALTAVGVEGLERGMIAANTGMTFDILDAVLAALALEDDTRAFWAGYDNARLVLRKYWTDWSVSVSPRAAGSITPAGEKVSAAPRRWVDIWGDLVISDFHRALKLIIGTAIVRPGLTESALRSRVSQYLDRLETNDLLQYLLDTGIMTRSLSIQTIRPLPPVQATDTNEMPVIVWTPNPVYLWTSPL